MNLDYNVKKAKDKAGPATEGGEEKDDAGEDDDW